MIEFYIVATIIIEAIIMYNAEDIRMVVLQGKYGDNPVKYHVLLFVITLLWPLWVAYEVAMRIKGVVRAK